MALGLSELNFTLESSHKMEGAQPEGEQTYNCEESSAHVRIGLVSLKSD